MVRLFICVMKNNVVSIARVIAMLMIVFCHLSSWLGLYAFAQIFNVGVEIFLLISGYLYSNRKIDSPFAFIKNKWRKLCVPMYIVFAVVSAYNLICLENLNVIKTIPIYLLNLQGLGFVITNLQMPSCLELGQLWFLTVIMINYIILLWVKRREKEENWRSYKKIVWVYVVLLLLDCVLAMFGVQLIWFLTFFIGYAFGKMDLKIEKRFYIIISIAMVTARMIRLVSREFMDGTTVYNNIIATLSHVVLSIWIFATISYIYGKYKVFCDKLTESKCWRWLEKYSMMIYMTHYMFLVGNFNVGKLHADIVLELLAFGMCTILASIFLGVVVDKLQDKCLIKRMR